MPDAQTTQASLDISRIQLPDGNIYNIKDDVARSLIGNNGTFELAWNGTGTPVASKIPNIVTVSYTNDNNQTATMTGTLAPGIVIDAETGEETSNTLKKFYLVKSSTQQNPTESDIYDEYITVTYNTNPVTYAWEKIGDTQIKLSTIVTDVTPTKQKLTTKSIYPVTSTTVNVSKVSPGDSQTTADGNFTIDSTTDAILKGWSVSSGGLLTLNGVSMDTQTTTQVVIDTESVAVAKRGSAVTVATGQVSSMDATSNVGATIVTDVTATQAT